MKKILLSALILLCCISQSAAWMNVTTVGGGVPAAGACTPTISFVQFSSSDTPATSISVPTGTTAGDLMIAGVISDTAEAQTMTGWTSLATVDSSSSRLTVAYRVMEVGDSTFQFTSSTTDDSAIIVSVRTTCGTWSIPSYDAEAVVNSLTVANGSAVTASAGDVLVFFGGDDDAPGIVDAVADMTLTATLGPGARALSAWYQTGASATTYTKTYESENLTDKSCVLLVAHAE